MDYWSCSCFLDHFLKEFRTVAIVDFKDSGKYFSFVHSNCNVILAIMLRLLLIRMQKKKKKMEDVLLGAFRPGSTHSDYDFMVSALISWVHMIAQEKNFK